MGKDLGVPDDLRDVASRVRDRWFERLWTAHRLEIEVAPARRLRRLRVQEGIRLYAPFGLGGDQDVWWVPVRERPFLHRTWRTLRTPGEAEHELDSVLQEAERSAV